MVKPRITCEINNTLHERARKAVDLVRFISVDHIANIALAEWLQRKEIRDVKDQRRKEKEERAYKQSIGIFEDAGEDDGEGWETEGKETT